MSFSILLTCRFINWYDFDISARIKPKIISIFCFYFLTKSHSWRLCSLRHPSAGCSTCTFIWEIWHFLLHYEISRQNLFWIDVNWSIESLFDGNYKTMHVIEKNGKFSWNAIAVHSMRHYFLRKYKTIIAVNTSYLILQSWCSAVRPHLYGLRLHVNNYRVI